MNSENTDVYGRLRKLRCHDGFLIAVELLDDNAIRLKFRRTDGTLPEVVLESVRRFSMNNFLEGNIVDSVYIWPFSEIPENQRRALLSVFSLSESDLLKTCDAESDKLFVIESSYGASVHALVRRANVSERS